MHVLRYANMILRTFCTLNSVERASRMRKRFARRRNFMVPSLTLASCSIVGSSIKAARDLDLTICPVLQGRDEFKPNPNGISSMFLYHATILVHGTCCDSCPTSLIEIDQFPRPFQYEQGRHQNLRYIIISRSRSPLRLESRAARRCTTEEGRSVASGYIS